MNRLHSLFSILTLSATLLVTTAAWCQQQENQPKRSPLTVEGYGFYDYHLATGDIGGGAVLLNWQVAPAFTLGGGIEYASSNRISARLEGKAVLLTTRKAQRLILTNSYLWRQYPNLDRQEFTSALQLGWQARHATVQLGLCNRYTAALVQRTNGGAGTIFEPMNVMFAVEGWWNNQTRPQTWNVGVRWSNYNDFIIERVANWFFSMEGFYALDNKTALTAEIGIHPVGSLNLTASYDGWYFHLGAMRKI